MNDNVKKRILRFIQEFSEEKGWSPSVREICDGVGLKSPSTVQRHLEELADAGRIVYQGIRQIRVVR